VLRARAVQLATPLSAPEQRDTWLEVISFQRAGRRYAIESRFVVEVGKCGHLSRVPGAQPGLLGVANLRGDLLPVFDLAGSTSALESQQLLVLGESEPDFGLVVDAAEDVSPLTLRSLTEPSALGSIPHGSHARGVDAEGRVLLDGKAMLLDRSTFVAKRVSGDSSERETT
jgi:purine-binding chemotaxis protein CheW